MQENLFKKTESQLYRYYEYKSKIQKFRRKVDDLEEQIISLDNQMRNVHKYISLDTMPPGAGCGERVQSSISGTSYMEKQMEQEVTCGGFTASGEKMTERSEAEKIRMDCDHNSAFVRSVEKQYFNS